MKKTIAFMCALILTAALLPASVSAEIRTYNFVRANENVCLYDYPDNPYVWHYTATAGDLYYYLGESEDVYCNGHTWYAILYDGGACYICDRYATLIRDVTDIRTSSSVALRTGPDIHYRLLQYIPAGQTIFINSFNWDGQVLWFHVSYHGTDGYVSSRYVTPVEGYIPPVDPYSSRTVTAALTERKMASRSGPSTKYYETGSFYSYGSSVTLYTRVYDRVNEIWWVQADAYENGSKCRVYTGSWRFAGLNVYELPEENQQGSGTLSRSAQLRCGPGGSYGYYDAWVYSGQQVSVWNYENGWAQIDCTVNGTPYRGWVEQNMLR